MVRVSSKKNKWNVFFVTEGTIIIRKRTTPSHTLLRDYRCPQHSLKAIIKSTSTYIYVHKSCL